MLSGQNTIPHTCTLNIKLISKEFKEYQVIFTAAKKKKGFIIVLHILFQKIADLIYLSVTIRQQTRQKVCVLGTVFKMPLFVIAVS